MIGYSIEENEDHKPGWIITFVDEHLKVLRIIESTEPKQEIAHSVARSYVRGRLDGRTD